MQTNWPIALLLAGGLVARIWLANALGLGGDESYGVAIGRVFSLGYFDHPPLAFWLARGAALVLGTEAAWAVRLPFIVLSTATTWLLFALTRDLFGRVAGFWAAAWFTLAPFFFLSAGSWVVPDGPLNFFVVLAAWALRPLALERFQQMWKPLLRPKERENKGLEPGFDPIKTEKALTPDASNSTARWLLVGAAIGMALLSKYHAVFFGLGVLVFAVSTRQGRRWFTQRAPYMAFGVALVLFAPVLVWNASNGWPSFAFQGARAIAGAGFSLSKGLVNFATMLAGQAAYLLPGTLVAGLWLVWRSAASRRIDQAGWYCVCLAVPAILAFNLISLTTERSLPHWPMVGFLFVFPLLGRWLAGAGPRLGSVNRWVFGASVGLWALAILVGTAQINRGALTATLFATPQSWDNTTELMDWTDLRDEFSRRGYFDGAGLVVVAPNWWQAGKIDYILGGRLPVLVLGRDGRHFAYLRDAAEYRGRQAIVVSRVHPSRAGPAQRRLLARAGAKLENLTVETPFALLRGGKPYYQFVVLRGDMKQAKDSK
ncbi:MAG: ArnT family glycosyltransferase [Alphaproteobacteria bacterium]